MVLCPGSDSSSASARRNGPPMSPQFCAGCDKPILERWVMHVTNRTWHARCVRCSVCRGTLEERCFSRDGKLFCKDDFFKQFGTKCGSCGEGLSPKDFVRRARDKVFHVACFTCSVCHRQLATGDQLYVLGDRFVCREDYQSGKAFLADFSTSDCFSEEEDDMLSTKSEDDTDSKLSDPDSGVGGFTPTGGYHAPSSAGGSGGPEGKGGLALGLGESALGAGTPLTTTGGETPEKIVSDDPETEDDKSDKNNNGGKLSALDDTGPGGKRRGPRTTIKAKQLEVLKNAFNNTPKPTRHIRETLAKETGLSMRVIQVWFQNRRSKERRMKQMSVMQAARRQGFFPRGPGPDFLPFGHPHGQFYDFYPGEPLPPGGPHYPPPNAHFPLPPMPPGGVHHGPPPPPDPFGPPPQDPPQQASIKTEDNGDFDLPDDPFTSDTPLWPIS